MFASLLIFRTPTNARSKKANNYLYSTHTHWFLYYTSKFSMLKKRTTRKNLILFILKVGGWGFNDGFPYMIHYNSQENIQGLCSFLLDLVKDTEQLYNVWTSLQYTIQVLLRNILLESKNI